MWPLHRLGIWGKASRQRASKRVVLFRFAVRNNTVVLLIIATYVVFADAGWAPALLHGGPRGGSSLAALVGLVVIAE